MKYYIAHDGQPLGPFESFEMLQQGLTPDTLVWNESLPNWVPASQVPELASLFPQQPQNWAYPQYQQPYEQPYGQFQNFQQPYGEPQFGFQPMGSQYADEEQPTMSFGEAIHTCLIKKYCDFSGRARRSEYWWFALAQTLYLVFVMVVGIAVIDSLNLSFDLFQVVWIVSFLPILLPSLAVQVRRLHDTGRSGLWILLSFVPCVNYIFAIVLLVWFCQDSDEDENEYGYSPKYQIPLNP